MIVSLLPRCCYAYAAFYADTIRLRHADADFSPASFATPTPFRLRPPLMLMRRLLI